MKRIRPLRLIAAGLCLLVTGFLYDVMFAGIPYQDPTPELSASYARHSRIASVMYWSGAGTFLIGFISGIIRLVSRSHAPRGNSRLAALRRADARDAERQSVRSHAERGNEL